MHPDFITMALHENARALDDRVRTAYLLRSADAAEAIQEEAVVLRLCSVHDDAALERLAQLDGKPLSTGRYVVAEVDGTLVAARPLYSGEALADPFRHTEHLLPLLEARARHLQRDESASGLALWRGLRRALHA